MVRQHFYPLLNYFNSYKPSYLTLRYSAVQNLSLTFPGDGNVSFEEFVDIAWSAGAGTDPEHVLSREEEEKELRDAFRVFDKHNRGYITASDLRAVLQCLGEDLSEEESKYFYKWRSCFISSKLCVFFFDTVTFFFQLRI